MKRILPIGIIIFLFLTIIVILWLYNPNLFIPFPNLTPTPIATSSLSPQLNQFRISTPCLEFMISDQVKQLKEYTTCNINDHFSINSISYNIRINSIYTVYQDTLFAIDGYYRYSDKKYAIASTDTYTISNLPVKVVLVQLDGVNEYWLTLNHPGVYQEGTDPISGFTVRITSSTNNAPDIKSLIEKIVQTITWK